MEEPETPDLNMRYMVGVSAISFLFPFIAAVAEIEAKGLRTLLSIALLGKWFIFFAVGIRLFIAGIRQTTNPAFTAKEIFHIDNPEGFPIVRELGFANLCFGLIGIISLFLPAWRIVSAFGSGVYYGIAGLQHLIKKPAGANEKFALISDMLIFICLVIYFVKMFSIK